MRKMTAAHSFGLTRRVLCYRNVSGTGSRHNMYLIQEQVVVCLIQEQMENRGHQCALLIWSRYFIKEKEINASYKSKW